MQENTAKKGQNRIHLQFRNREYYKKKTKITCRKFKEFSKTPYTTSRM